ncbi:MULTISPECIES: hypothetical protein [Bacteria]
MSADEVAELARDARGRAAIVSHGTGTGQAYLRYAEAPEAFAEVLRG